jgi:hypothetical protein
MNIPVKVDCLLKGGSRLFLPLKIIIKLKDNDSIHAREAFSWLSWTKLQVLIFHFFYKETKEMQTFMYIKIKNFFYKINRVRCKTSLDIHINKKKNSKFWFFFLFFLKKLRNTNFYVD